MSPTPENSDVLGAPAPTAKAEPREVDRSTPPPRVAAANAEPSPLYNLLLNVILPVMVLEWLSKEGGKPWHLGPAWALLIAVALPLGYAVWFFVQTKKTNVISLVGLASVLLTGGIAWAAWRPDGSVDPSLFKIYAIKEALLPAIIGLCVVLSHRTARPLVRVMIFNDQFFNLPLIEDAIQKLGTRPAFEKLLWHSALILGGTFLLSGVLSYLLALYFLGGLDATATNARELYNKAVSKQTLWGFVAIGLPFVLVLAVLLRALLTRLELLTGLTREALTSDD